MATLKNNNIVQAWLVLVLAICFGALLTGIQMTLSPKIAANKINEIRHKIPTVILGENKARLFSEKSKALDVESQVIKVPKGNITSLYTVYKVLSDGEVMGWATKASGQGYADKIELLIGLGPRVEFIKGIFVLDQKETPGLGAKITDSSWRNQFVNKGTDRNLVVVKTKAENPYEINAITGATISSKSVESVVNKTIKDIKGPLSRNK